MSSLDLKNKILVNDLSQGVNICEWILCLGLKIITWKMRCRIREKSLEDLLGSKMKPGFHSVYILPYPFPESESLNDDGTWRGLFIAKGCWD